MIRGTHACIRSTELEDAPGLLRLYDPAVPRAALLDRRYELLTPTLSELRELLATKKGDQRTLYTVENIDGEVAGFCNVRGATLEVRSANLDLLFLNEESYAAPIAEETFSFLMSRGFEKLQLKKMVANCFGHERALHAFLVAHGFQSDGIYRDVFQGLGRKHDIESLSLFH